MKFLNNIYKETDIQKQEEKMKKTILMLFLLSTCLIFLNNFVLITAGAYEYTWNQIQDDESISSSFTFHLYAGAPKQKEGFLENDEFLLGDRLDYCNIVILETKPDKLEVEPKKIEIVTPSGLTYSENFRQTRNENSFTAGHLSKDGERAIANFNESGLWSIRIEFQHEGTPIGFRYCGTYSKDFDYDSKITVFNSGINVNVYTTSEYAQLRAARASETSAFWSYISTIFLIIAAIIAVISILVSLWKHRKEQDEKNLEIRADCKNKVSKTLISIKAILTNITSCYCIRQVGSDGIPTDARINMYKDIENKFIQAYNNFLQDLSYISTFSNTNDLIQELNKIDKKFQKFYKEAVLNILSKETVSDNEMDIMINDILSIEKLINNFLFMNIK